MASTFVIGVCFSSHSPSIAPSQYAAKRRRLPVIAFFTVLRKIETLHFMFFA